MKKHFHGPFQQAAGPENVTRRRIRSYALRQGRFTDAQRKALDTLWPQYGIDYCNHALDPNAHFTQTSPVVLEIGFGNGNSLIQQALASPNENFIGIEVHKPGVGHLLRLIEKNVAPNLKIIHYDAVDVFSAMINDASIARIQIFFPDPWHKKRHHRRRLINTEFVEELRKKLVPSGILHVATDWEHYAHQILHLVENNTGFTNCAGCGNYTEKPAYRPITRFEQRGQKLGHGVWDIVFEKQSR